MASEAANPQHHTEHKPDPKKQKQKHVSPVITQDLSRYTPQRHFWSANRRSMKKSRRVEVWRDEIVTKRNAATLGRGDVEENDVVEEGRIGVAGLPSEAEMLPEGEGSESRIDLLVRDAVVCNSYTTTARPTVRGTNYTEETRTPVPGASSRVENLRRSESSEPRIDFPVQDAAVENSTTTPGPSTVKLARSTPRTILLRGFSRDGSTVLRTARTAPRVRNVATSAIKWRETPVQEPIVVVPPPPPPAPILPTPKKKLPARTYKTQARSTLPEPSWRSITGHRCGDVGGDVVNVEAEEKNVKNGYDLEPSTSSFQYPEDGLPLIMPQESRTLEDYLRHGQRASTVRGVGRNVLPIGVSRSDEESEVEQDEDEEDIEAGEDEKVEDEVDEEVGEEQNHVLDDEPLSEMEIQLLGMGGSDDGNHLTSASPSPKRPRAADGFESTDGEKRNNGGDSAPEDTDEQMPVKKRRTERRVPSAETRKAALHRLNDSRAAKATRQTSDIATVVVTKTKRPKKTKKEKSAKQPRRLPVDGELLTGPERLDGSDIEAAIAPPLELSQDPISQIFDSEDGDDTRRNRPMSINIKKPKGFGKVDTSLFRIPERPQLQDQVAQNINFSDGFSGKEREPIGRLMPVKQPNRRKQTCQNLPIRYGELSLVSERPTEETPEEPRRRHKKSHKSKNTVSRSVVPPHDNEPMLLDEEEEPQHINPMFQNLETTHEAAKPRTPIIADQSMLSSTPAGNTSPLKNKSQKFRHGLKDFQQVQTKAASQIPAAGYHQEADVPQPPSTIPMLVQTEKQRGNDQIASQEISLVVMKRPNHHGDEKNEKSESDDQELADDEEQESSNESESDEDKPYLPTSENEDDEDAQELDVTDELDLEPETETVTYEDGRAEPEVNLNDQVGDSGDMPAGHHEEEHSVQEPSAVRTPRGGVAMFQPHLQEIANLVLEIQQHTELEKARLKEKSQTPLSSKRARTTYPSKVRSQESRSSQQLAVTNHALNSAKTEIPSSQLTQHNTHDFDSSWRPRVPDTRGPAMQVDEEIDDSATPPRERERAARSRIRSLRRRSSTRSQSLYVVDEIPETASFEEPPAMVHDSQAGSIILGDTQNFHRSFPADIPETQVEDDDEGTRVVMVPNVSYFSQASQNLSQPLRASRINRTLSTPTRAREHFEDGNGLMVGGISISAALQYKVSPTKSSSNRKLGQRQTASQQRTPSQNRSLREITRSASAGLGTLPGSAGRRTVSLKFDPPFIKLSTAEGTL